MAETMKSTIANLSTRRLLGFACNRLWEALLFYSLIPYYLATDERGLLYSNMTISLGVMVCTLLFLAVLMRNRDKLLLSRYFQYAAGLSVALGTSLISASRMFPEAAALFTTFSALLTGVGSAVLLLGWIKLYTSLPGRTVLIEISCAYAIAFGVGIVLLISPGYFSIAVNVLSPLVSCVLLRHCAVNRPERHIVTVHEFSSSTKRLFAKALFGAVLFGCFAGFFDALTGYKSYDIPDAYGTVLFLGGLAASALLAVLALLGKQENIHYPYRVSLLLLCIGGLLCLFLADGNNYSNVVIFAGYISFTIALIVISVDVSKSFRLSSTRTAGFGFGAMYFGELGGLFLGLALGIADFGALGISVCVTVAISILLFSHLFLFTELDLVRAGIGEVDVGEAAPTPQPVAAEETPTVDASEYLAQRYGLTPRETEVLPLLLKGRTIARIQEELFISQGTVSTHIRHIYQKTECDNRQELIDLASEINEDGR